MSKFDHICSDRECVYLGQRTSPNMCECHKSTDQMMHTALVSALSELYAQVKGECPSLLNEDSGGNSRLDLEIQDLLAAVGSPK